MTAKTPNIRYIVAKTHLLQSTRFFKQQMSPFYPFRGGGSPKGDNVTFFYRFFISGLPLAYNAMHLAYRQEFLGWYKTSFQN